MLPSGVRSGDAPAQHAVLVRDRGEQAQDGAAAVADLPRHLPQGHRVQLPVQGSARATHSARVPRLRPVFRRTAVSCMLTC